MLDVAEWEVEEDRSESKCCGVGRRRSTYNFHNYTFIMYLDYTYNRQALRALDIKCVAGGRLGSTVLVC